MRRAVALVGTLACLALLAVEVRAQAKADHEADEQAIRSVTKQYLAALERGDTKALAEFWVPDGDIVDATGQAFPAKQIYGEEAKESREGPRPVVKVASTAIRFLTPDVALEDGTSEVSHPSEEGSVPVRGRFTIVWLKQNGKWRLASLRESRAHQPPTEGDLADLDWMIGDWSGNDDNLEIDLKARWNSTHTYMIRELTLRSEGEVIFDGTQRIGWDPISRKVKSWMFDSDGGHGEGSWTKSGDTWIVQAQGVLPDGRRTTSTNMYLPDGPNAMIWKSVSAATHGESAPDLQIKLERKPAEK